MSDLWTNRQMQDLPPDVQARRAIAHTLQTIRDNWQAGYHLGMGTQTFALLTEAAATLFGQSDLKKLREDFVPRSDKPADSELVRDIVSLAQDLQVRLKQCSSERPFSFANNQYRSEFTNAVLNKLKEAGKI